jgi:hypothetical protein
MIAVTSCHQIAGQDHDTAIPHLALSISYRQTEHKVKQY